jgi:xanthosine utilization system XapX-like protein
MNRSKTPAGRRYIARFTPAMLAYVVVLMGSLWSIRHLDPTGPFLWALAVAPALPVIAVIAVMGLYLIEETDEFIRAVLVQSMLWGIGITLSACTAWGFLENAEVVPHLPLYLVFPAFCGSFGLAQPFVRRRYQ